MSSSYYSSAREETPFSSSTRQIPRYTRTVSDRTMDSGADLTDRVTSAANSAAATAGAATMTPSTSASGIAPRVHIRTQQGRPPVVHMELSFNGTISSHFFTYMNAYDH